MNSLPAHKSCDMADKSALKNFAGIIYVWFMKGYYENFTDHFNYINHAVGMQQKGRKHAGDKK